MATLRVPMTDIAGSGSAAPSGRNLYVIFPGLKPWAVYSPFVGAVETWVARCSGIFAPPFRTDAILRVSQGKPWAMRSSPFRAKIRHQTY